MAERAGVGSKTAAAKTSRTPTKRSSPTWLIILTKCAGNVFASKKFSRSKSNAKCRAQASTSRLHDLGLCHMPRRATRSARSAKRRDAADLRNERHAAEVPGPTTSSLPGPQLPFHSPLVRLGRQIPNLRLARSCPYRWKRFCRIP